MKWILIGYGVWVFCGLVSRTMVKRACLHDYPNLRKRGEAWTKKDDIKFTVGAFFYGPIGILAALIVWGKSCFRSS